MVLRAGQKHVQQLSVYLKSGKITFYKNTWDSGNNTSGIYSVAYMEDRRGT
jgi:hypothetical protein